MPKKKTKEVNDVKAEIKKIVKKKKRKVYFGQEVQDAIIKYNGSSNDGERNRIYGKEIHKAFDKLAENIINTFKFTYFDMPFEDVKHEVVAFMVMNIHKYDHTKGSKAFSYFSIVAKNYLILHNNANYKKYKTHNDIKVLNYQPVEPETDFDELIFEIVKYFENSIPSIFKKKRDIDIAYALLEILKRPQEIENFNKKSLYILIREMTDVETVHITNVVNLLKTDYKKRFEEFSNEGYITTTSNNFF